MTILLLLPIMSFAQNREDCDRLRKAAELCIYSKANSLEEANSIVEEAFEAYGSLLESLPQNNYAERDLIHIAINNIAAGFYVNRLNDSESALVLCDETENLLKRYPEESYERYVMLLCRAAAYMLDYKFDKAEECLMGCLESTEDKLLAAPVFTNMGIMCSRLGNERDALKMFRQAESIYANNGCLDSYGYASLLTERGVLLAKHNKVIDGIADLDRAVNIYETLYGRQNPLTVNCLLEYAKACFKGGSEDTFKRASDEIGDIIDSNYAKKNIGLWFKWVKLLTAQAIGLKMYDEIDDILELGNELVTADSPEELDYRYLLGTVSLGKGAYDKAVKEFSRMLTLEKRFVNEVFMYLPEIQRAEYWESCETRLNGIRSLIRVGGTSDAGQLLYNTALFHKGLLLETTLGLSRIVEASGDANMKADFLRLQVLRQRQLRESGLEEELQKESETLERSLMTRALQYGNYIAFTSTAWQDVDEMLKNGDVAIEFVSVHENGRTYYSAEVLRKDFDAPRHVPLFSLSEDEKQRWAGSACCDSLALGRAMWGKLLPFLKEGADVYFSADGILHSSPIEYFTIFDGVRMDDRYSIHRLSSTRSICHNNGKERDKTAVLYGGLNYNAGVEDILMSAAANAMRGSNPSSLERLWNYLGGTRREVDMVESILAENGYTVQKLQAEAGTEDSFKSLSGNSPGIIHLATHGFMTPLDSLSLGSAEDTGLSDTGIVFAGANNKSGSLEAAGMEDGILNAKEISLLDLKNTGLVVLSACETGLGHITAEGVFGLQRGFKKAGVTSLLMTLWPISDQATELIMTDFYCNLVSGMSADKALRTARRAVWNQSFKVDGKDISGSDPIFWAGFVLLD